MSKLEYDIFHNERIYPDADHIFAIKLACLNDIKDDCIYILDTNALLVPYSTGSQSLKEIGVILSKLKTQKRLFVPAQVAREFADNRPKKLGEMYYSLTNKQNSIQDLSIGQYPLLEEISEYKEALEIEKELKTLIVKYRKTIGKISDTVKNWTWDDPVSQLYRNIFTPDLILKLNTNQEDVKKELDYRYLHKIPPGYKDDGKEDSGIGDLLIWLSILEIGKQKRNVVFVSADVKSDWYHKSNKTALYPRFELLAEFQQVSDNHAFHIIRLSELLAIMGADELVVSEVKSEELVDFTTNPQVLHLIAESAVINWYKRRYTSIIKQGYPGNYKIADFAYTNDDGEEILVDVLLIKSSMSLTLRKLKDDILKLRYSVSESGRLADLVLVARTKEFSFDHLRTEILDMDLKMGIQGSGINIKIGFLDSESRFCPLFDNWESLN